MEAIIGGAVVAFIAQFTLIWYRIGRVEAKLDGLCRRVNKLNGTGEGGEK